MTSNHTQPKGEIQFFIHTVGKEPGQIIREYITVRYDRWLDYSKYKCSLQNMGELAADLLDEVLLNVLQRDEQVLLKMYNKKKIQKGKEYTDLDFFILRAIDLNSTSDNAPFRWKNKPIPTNREVKLERLKIIDEEYSEVDRPAEILKNMRLVHWVVNGLQMDPVDKRIFEWKFFEGNSLSDWSGPEDFKKLYGKYHKVEAAIHQVLYRLELTRLKPADLRTKLTGCQIDEVFELAENFLKRRKISIKHL
jgi:hypothetical protein